MKNLNTHKEEYYLILIKDIKPGLKVPNLVVRQKN